MSLSIENVLIQVRAKLQENGIKLWLSPYYSNDIGPIDSELEVSSSYALFFFCSKQFCNVMKENVNDI